MSAATVDRARHYSPRGDTTRASYLGYPLEITNDDVSVFDRRGRKLVTVASIGAARLFIRGYRRDVPVTAEPAASLAKATAGSDDQGA